MKNFKIKAGSFTNKGDMLMFFAIIQKLQGHGRICVEYGRISFSESKKHEVFFSKSRRSLKEFKPWHIKTIKRLLGHIINYMPEWLLLFFRFIPEHKIDVLLDASGYAYGDYWGERKILNAIQEYSALENAKKIIMPQSLGPFEKKEVKSAFKKLTEIVDLIYARDATSLEFTKKIISTDKKLKQSPDFTFDIEPVKPKNIHLPDTYVVIIPNHRLVMKENNGDFNLYLEFLSTCVDTLKKEKVEPVFLAHDIAHDTFIIKALQNKIGFNVKTVVEKDVRLIRWVINKSTFTISSRFHGMINALTQCVPVIGMGWTHKYKQLAMEYGVERFLIEPGVSKEEIRKLIVELLDKKNRNKVIDQIEKKRNHQKKYSDAMWNEIAEIINS